MEKIEIIQSEVKNGLSDFGLNDEERKDYENLILEQVKDKTFEKEEDLINEVKINVQSFIPSVKILQKSRTKIQQEKSDLQKKLEEYKKNNPQTKTEPPKNPEPPKDDTPDWAKALLKKIENIEEERESEKKAKIIKDKRENTLSVIKEKYNKSIHSTIDVLANGIDWNKETAENEFKDLLSNLAKDNPVWLVKADDKGNKQEKNILLSTSSIKDDKAKQEEFQKKLV